MKKFLLFAFLVFCFISNQPVSLSDREFVILYFCDMNGNYEFDLDGRKGLATISGIKKQELKKVNDHRGEVFLISGGNFSGKGDNLKAHFSLLNKVGFDGVFIGEDELSYLESNPALKNLKLPLIAHRENSFQALQEMKLIREGIQFRISNTLSPLEDTKIDVQLLFHTGGSYNYLNSVDLQNPVYFFLNESDISSFKYKKNIYTVQCPTPEKLGKLSLYFRKKNLIRQKQEFIPLNTIDVNSDWISPDREIINELK